MPFDYKKEYKELYLPPETPQIVEVPSMDFLAVRGQGDPNQEGGAYKAAIGQLYAVAYTIKMSKLGKHKLEGYFDYVVPPLEGLWWMEGGGAIDFAHKERFQAFHWAVREAERKKGLDCSGVGFFSYEDGLCVQCMHLGPYDGEGETIRAMERYAEEQGYILDQSEHRRHHEIYLSDVRRCRPERLKTVIRQPVKR